MEETRKTIVVNLFAGPGAGKSTFCSGVFAELKWKDINCEMALEYAKDKVWEGSLNTLKDQFYVFGKQEHRLFRLNNQVDVIITDAPLLNSVVYDVKNNEHFKNLIIEEHHKYKNLNYFIERTKPYNPKGRYQTLEGAKKLDTEIKDMLVQNNIEFKEILGHKENIHQIVEDVIRELNS